MHPTSGQVTATAADAGLPSAFGGAGVPLYPCTTSPPHDPGLVGSTQLNPLAAPYIPLAALPLDPLPGQETPNICLPWPLPDPPHTLLRMGAVEDNTRETPGYFIGTPGWAPPPEPDRGLSPLLPHPRCHTTPHTPAAPRWLPGAPWLLPPLAPWAQVLPWCLPLFNSLCRFRAHHPSSPCAACLTGLQTVGAKVLR